MIIIPLGLCNQRTEKRLENKNSFNIRFIIFFFQQPSFINTATLDILERNIFVKINLKIISQTKSCFGKMDICKDSNIRNVKHGYVKLTLEFQIEGEGGINGEAGKFRPK